MYVRCTIELVRIVNLDSRLRLGQKYAVTVINAENGWSKQY